MTNSKKNNRIDTDDGAIDEQYLMSIMAGESPSKRNTVSTHRDRIKTSGSPDSEPDSVHVPPNYGAQFLKHHSMAKRGDKSIYIRSDYHERLSRIVQVIGDDQIPLYAYLDNILEHHFAQFETAITKDYEEKHKPLF